MDGSNHERLHTIGEAVAALRATYPDVSHSSLRFFEREGLIHPHRTPGGHRLYADRDLRRLRLIKRWQAARLSLAEIRARLDERASPESWGGVAERFLDFVLAGQMDAARRSVLANDELGMPLARMFAEVLQPAMVEIGARWAAGTLTVAQEHELSEVVRDLVAQLTLRHLPDEPGVPVIVAACVAGEKHELGLRMVAGMLRERGAQVHFLGADVLPEFIVESAERLAPSIVLLSVSLPEHVPALHETLAALHETKWVSPSPTILVGGHALAGQDHITGYPDVRVLGTVTATAVVEVVLDGARRC
jgi:methanogenic corrinoid protein MtbC1